MTARQAPFKLIIGFILALYGQLSFASAEVKPTLIDVPTFTSVLEQALIQGVQSTSQVLNRLGEDVQQALRDTQEKSDFKYYNFSARSQIEMLYQRAEAGGAGQGNLFLARLKDSLAQDSAAIASDPKLKFLDSVPRRPGPIAFAGIATMDADAVANQLSPAVDEALTILSEHTASRGIAHVRGVLIRNLNFDPAANGRESLRKFDEIVHKSASVKGVLAAAFLAHLPPPLLQRVLQQIFLDFAASSGAFAADPAVGKVMNNLSSELNPAEQRLIQSDGAFRSAHDVIPMSTAPPVDAPSESQAALAVSRAIEAAPENPPGDGIGLPIPQPQPKGTDRLTQKHQQYIEQSFERRDPSANAGPPPFWWQSSRPPPPVPRKYAIAILSPRAARGIAVGAEMRDGTSRLPLKAYWISDKSDDRFGRVVVSFAPCKENWLKVIWEFLKACNGDPIVAVSSRIHVDSFMAANQLLWGTFNHETQFVEGEITVLMSMNPWVVPDDVLPLKDEVKRRIERYNDLINTYNSERAAPSSTKGLSGLSDPRFTSQLDIEWRRLYEDNPQLRPLFQLRNPALQFDAKREKLRENIDKAKVNVEVAEQNYKNFAASHFRHSDIPRSIVFHPAVHGRALAWAAARVDFWFNDTQRLFDEANMVAADKNATDNMRQVLDTARQGAGTWQYFEQEGTIELNYNESGPALIVRGPTDRSSDEDGRFAVSLFRVSGGGEESAYHLSEGEANIKKPLAWLQHTHPDFWRLSDFSTSLMLLRYLKSQKIQLISFSPDNFDPKQPTPEWIYGKEVEPAVQP